MLVTGPTGSGKTAAVYAAAEVRVRNRVNSSSISQALFVNLIIRFSGYSGVPLNRTGQEYNDVSGVS